MAVMILLQIEQVEGAQAEVSGSQVEKEQYTKT